MLQEYKFIKGKEIKTYQDILECKEYGIILRDLNWSTYHYNIDILLRDTEALTMKRFQQIKDEGYSVHQRVKKYRDIVFSKDLDVEIGDILIDFSHDYEYAYSSDDVERYLQKTLVELKELILKTKENQ